MLMFFVYITIFSRTVMKKWKTTVLFIVELFVNV